MAKNILFITSSYPFGGGESFIIPEIKYLSKIFKVYVIPTHPRGDIRLDSPNNENIKYLTLLLIQVNYLCITIFFSFLHPILFSKLIYHCKSDSLIRMIRNLVLIPKSIYISNIVKGKNINFIYAHWLSAPAQLALLVHLIISVPYGITGHRWDLIDANNFDLKFKYAKFIRLISYKSTTLLPKIIQEKYKKKINNIYLGTSVSMKSKMEAPDNVTKIVCVGNLIPVKGHQYLINAIYELHKRGYEVFLDLIGSGELENEIKKQIIALKLKNYIRVLGYMAHSQVQSSLNSGEYNLYCQPSVDLGKGSHEGIPVSLMEAMNAKIPCIATNTGSIPELIINYETGLLVEDKNSNALADAIQILITEPNLANTLIENAYKKISIDFNQELNNKKLTKLISSIEKYGNY